ncbi:class I SAM-dependent methyltransferase [Gemmatimonas sp.]|uniref:class I SAM-dependent methyltransferase n=1 Tax=Gemmatimonas sp. TaxID=1962908 RepID=UPI0039837065
MSGDFDDRIITSWHTNAAPWVRAIRQREIVSRVDVTNDAIVSTLRSLRPTHLLDVGCGEGWLCHAMARDGVSCVGVDVVPALIDAARASHPVDAVPGTYAVLAYDAIATGALSDHDVGAFDVIVSNFALIGEAPVETMLAALPALMAPGGHVVIQTLHPVMASLDVPYVDGWREGSWTGFSSEFADAPPWYFRTISSWVALLTQVGLTMRALHEPVFPETGRPASLILCANRAD